MGNTAYMHPGNPTLAKGMRPRKKVSPLAMQWPFQLHFLLHPSLCWPSCMCVWTSIAVFVLLRYAMLRHSQSICQIRIRMVLANI